MENINTKNATWNWWRELGRWQLFYTVIILAIFFIVLYLTKDLLIVLNSVIGIIFVTRIIIKYIFKSCTRVMESIITVILAAVLISLFSFLGKEIFAIIFLLTILYLIIKEKADNGRRSLFLPLLAQFIIVLLPMLGVVLHWW